MELALSLGDNTTPNSNKPSFPSNIKLPSSMALGFCVGLGHDCSGSASGSVQDEEDDDDDNEQKMILPYLGSASNPPIQLDLLPLAPVRRSSHLQFPWLSDHVIPELGCGEGVFDVNRLPAEEETDDRTAAAATTALSSPNSTVSSFQMDFGVRINNNGKRSSDNNMEMEMEMERGSSRISDDEENGCARKKLRLSKQQSAFLEDSFKEHSTLNPKQKLALAKQLNLRPRQVEVWFQNRRARTKLKQTEVDCEYLRRCCETLTEENRRLQKELQELRALKTSQPFYMQLPATTLTMCPSCERVATTAPTAPASNHQSSALCLAKKPRILPFPHLNQAAS